jgi:hypothetical protein
MDVGPRARQVIGYAVNLIIVVVVLAFHALAPKGTSLDCEIRQVDSRRVEQTSISIRALWAVTGIHPRNSHDSRLLVSTPNLVIAADSGCNRVMALNLETGAIVWDKAELFGPGHITLDEARQRIYVSSTQNITALSVTDGEVIWSNSSERFIRNAHAAFLHDDGQLTVEANEGDWAIDPDSGELSPTDLRTEPTERELADEVYAAIENTSIASNIVTSDGITFALDENAVLHLLDMSAGTTLGNITFTAPQPTELLYQPGGIGGSWLTIRGDNLAIYFQDTQLLAAYEVNLAE